MRLFVGICLLLLVSCDKNTPAISLSDVVEVYVDGLNTSNFDRINSVLADSITLIEGDYTVPMSSEGYYVQFQWDSVFTPNTQIIDIQEVDQNQVMATLSATSLRFAYLDNNPLVCEITFTFESGKIKLLETGDCPGANWAVWESRRDTLVAWIDQTHPELNGFIYDLTKAGAENYLQAIELYENR